LYGENFIRFIIALIIIAGAVLKVVYNSYGLASLPMLLIKGTRSLEDEKEVISENMEAIRNKLRTIQEKYARNQK